MKSIEENLFKLNFNLILSFYRKNKLFIRLNVFGLQFFAKLIWLRQKAFLTNSKILGWNKFPITQIRNYRKFWEFDGDENLGYKESQKGNFLTKQNNSHVMMKLAKRSQKKRKKTPFWSHASLFID